MDSSALKDVFEKKLGELSLSYQQQSDNTYLLYITNELARTIKVRLICSNKPSGKHGSQNGNAVQSIGVFRFKITQDQHATELYVLAFESRNHHRTDFVIIPTSELLERLVKKNRNSTANQRISLVLWLMDDRSLYETSHLGIEGEWYFFTPGLNGRQADNTGWDYSEFLNDWDRLKLCNIFHP